MTGKLRTFLAIGLTAGGALALLWTLLVWQWRDPFTSLYTEVEQRRLARAYEELSSSAALVTARGDVARTAKAQRLAAGLGEPIGRIRIERLDLDMVLVNGTDPASLRKGPGRDLRSFMPGEGRLVYVAGHRTTYRAPFADIDSLRKGDRIEIEVPYGTFAYVVAGHRVVDARDLSVLRSPKREVLRLQACHPRFFASQRYVVFARPVEPTAAAIASSASAFSTDERSPGS
jgi:sortase A